MAVTAVNNNQPVFEVPKPVRKTGAVQEKLGMIVDATQSFVNTVDHSFTKVSEKVKNVFGAFSFVGGVGLFFAIPNMISNITKAVASSNTVDRIKNIGRAILDGTAVWMSTNAILNGLQSVKVLSASALSWTYVVNVVLFPLQLIGIGIDTHDLGELKAQRKEVLTRLDVKDLTKSLDYVKENHDTLRKILGISKKCRIEERAEAVKDNKAEAQQFIKMLRTRVSTKYNLKIADLTIKIATLFVTATMLFLPLNPISMGFAGLCGLAGLANFGVEKLMMNKDPLATSDAWYSKVANKMRSACDYITDAIDRKNNAPGIAASAA